MLRAGVTPFACVQECERRLSENGFENIDYTETWNLVPGGKYMVNHHGTTLFAFTVYISISPLLKALYTSPIVSYFLINISFSIGNLFRFQ